MKLILKSIKSIIRGVNKKIDEISSRVDEIINNLPTKLTDLKNDLVIEFDYNQNDKTAVDYIKNRPFYDSTGWVQTTLIDDDWSAKSTCKFESTPVEWSENGFYKVRVDGVEYQFNGMETTYISTLNKVVFYIGAKYELRNSAIDYGTYPFCFVTDDIVHKNIYAVFPDKTMNHVVEFYVEEIVKIDEKFLPDTVATKEEVYKLSEDIANLNIPTVDDILNELPTWQGGAY